MKTKQCNNCNEHKPATTEFFGRKKGTRDGLYGFCKVCTNAKSKLWRENNKAKKAELDKVYREKNRAKVKEKKQAYYRDNAERIKAKRRQAYADDPQKFIDASREYKKKRKQTDPTFRLRERISNAIYCVLFRDCRLYTSDAADE